MASSSINDIPKDGAEWHQWVVRRLNQLARHSHGTAQVFAITRTPGNTDASGFATFTHACPFTPTEIIAQQASPSSSFAVVWGVDNITATQCRVRFMRADTAGAFVSAAPGTVRLICFAN